MEIRTCESPSPLLDELQNSLEHVLNILQRKYKSKELSLSTVESASNDESETSYRVEGVRGQSLKLSFEVVPLPESQYEVKVDISGGPTRRFTCSLPLHSDGEKGNANTLRPQVTAFLFDELSDRLGQTSPDWSFPLQVTPHVPRLALNRDGKIQDLNTAACRVLECESQEDVEPNFFTYVHGRNLRRVMWDLAQMVNQGMKRSQWLLRLRTGNDRWRWYRAAAHNHLRSAGTIQIHLRPL